MLKKEDIQQKSKCAIHPEPVPEWGGDVGLRDLSIDEQLNMQSEMRVLVKDVPRDAEGKLIVAQIDRTKARDIGIRYLAIALVDDAGQSMFSVEELGAMSQLYEDVLDRLANKVFANNAIKSDAVEAEAKNSDASLNAS